MPYIKINKSIFNNLFIILLQLQLLLFFCVVIFYLLRSFHLTFFVPAISIDPAVGKSVSSNFIYAYSWIIIFACIEELIYRYLPYVLVKKYLSATIRFYLYVIVTSFFFAISHTSFVYGFRFPLVQFIAGLYFSSLYRQKYGLGYAAFSHSIYNILLPIYIGLVF